MKGRTTNPVRKILELLRFERKEIFAIYMFAVFSGLVQLSLPLGIQSIINFVLAGSFSTSLVILIILVVAGVFITGLLQVNQMKIIEKIQQQLFVRYSFLYAYHLPRINLKDTDALYLPEVVNRFFDTVSLQKGLAKLLLQFPAATIQILFGLILLSFYHPIFIIFGITLITILYLILQFSGTRGLQTSIEESNFKYDVAGWLQEMARAITSFKFSRGSQLHLFKTDEKVTGYLKARTAHFDILLFQYWSLIVFKVLITAAMLIVGSFLLVNQQLNIGQFIAAEIIILTVMSSVEKLIGNLDKVYDVLTSVEKLGKLTDQPLEITGDMPLQPLKSGIHLQVNQLSFGYMKERLVLKNISFTARPGQKICIKGPDGSGKSTLLKVLTGSYQPFEGVIAIDDVPISNYHIEMLRSQTGILLGDQYIFEGSLMQNITLGKEDVSLVSLLMLAEKIGLKSFIESTPEGLQVQLDPAGNRLPRKVKQKILLMRAMIHQPRLLLMEEPWLGLDNQDADKLKQFLAHEFSATTLIVTTNDKKFEALCDQVIELEDGKVKAIVENG